MAKTRRIARISLTILTGLAVAVLASLAAAMLFLRSETGQTYLGARAGELLSEPGGPQVRIARVGVSPLLARIRASGLTVADQAGDWATAESVVIAWHPLELLSGRLRIETARLSKVALLRLPAAAAAGEDSAAPLTLPLDVELAALELRDLILGKEVLGQAATFELRGGGRYGRAGRVELEFEANRTDGPEGSIAARVQWASSPRDFMLSLRASEGAGGLVAGLLDLPASSGLALRLDGRGPPEAWEGTASGRLDGVASVQSRLGLNAAAPSYTISATGTGEYLGRADDEARVLLSRPMSFDIEARWLGSGEIELLRADFKNEMVTVSAAGRYDSARLTGTAETSVAVRHPSDVALEGTAALRLDGPKIAADVRALRITSPELTAALRQTVGVSYEPGRVAVDGLDLDVDGARIAGSGELSADRMTLALDIEGFELGMVSRFAPDVAISGIVNGQVRAEGPLSAPAGEFAVTVVNGRSADPALRGLPDLSGKISGTVEGGRMALVGDLSAGADNKIRLSSEFPFRLSSYPPQLDISADEPVAAQIAVTGLELARFTGGTRAPTEGRLDGTVDIAGTLARPTGRYDLSFAGLRIKAFGLGDLPSTSGTVRGELRTDGARMSAELRATDGTDASLTAALPTRISFVPFAAELRPDAPVTADLDMRNLSLAQIGRLDPAFPLTGRSSGKAAVTGSLAKPSAIVTLSLTDLRANWPGAEPLSPLAGQVTARLEDGRAELAADLSGATDTKLRLRGNTLLQVSALPFSWSVSPDAPVSADMQVSDLPARAFKAVAPGTDVRGRIAADFRLGGSLGAPQGSFKVTGDGLGLGRKAAADIPPLKAEIDGTLDAAGLSLRGSVRGLQETVVTLEGSLPVRATAFPAALELARDRPVAGKLRWAGEIGPVFDLFPVGPQRLDGRANIVLDLAGTIAAPKLGGEVSLAAGAYEHLVSGTVLETIELALAYERERLVVRRGTATDGDDGRIVVTGDMRLGPDLRPYVDLTVRMDGLTVIRRDELTASIGGQLRLVGALGDARLTGRIETKRVEASLLADLPREVVDLPVVEAGAETAADDEQAQARREASRALRGLVLDVAVVMPGSVFIRGRGLQSEWRGEFAISGTAAEPRVTGSLRPVRGDFNAFGKTFALGEGSISMNGGKALDPVLDLRALYDGSDLQAVVLIRGSAAAPEIELTSSPPLPQDEIISRLLFGKSVGELTAFQALQVADTVSTLTGSGKGVGGVLGVARRTLGVDTLRVEGGEEGTDDIGLGIGKRVSEDVYVEVIQGSTPGSSRTRVELDVTPNLQLESDVGADARTGAGIKWKWDY